MALIAHLAGHGLMDVSKEYTCPIGTMRVMTGGTARLRNRIIHMLAYKGRRVRLMALHTEGGQSIL